MVRYRYNT